MRKYILLTLFLLSGAILFGATADESIQQAKVKYAAGNSSEAISILDGVVKENPSNLQAKRILADICVDTGEREYDIRNFKNAYEYFKKAVKLLPTHPIATERYWKMKSDFDVNNLKNEGGAVSVKDAAVKDSSTSKTADSSIEKKRIETVQKEIKRIEANPRIADDIYAKKIVGMEERFNQRLLDMNAQMKKNTELEKEKGLLSEIAGSTPLLITAMGLFIVLSALLLMFVNFLIKFIKKRNKTKKGDKEYERLFADNSGQYYNELIKMQNIKELINRIKAGDLDWSMIKKSISEMDRELRLEVFSYIETKVESNRQPVTMEQADILMALILDGDEYLRRRVSSFLTNQSPALPGQSGVKALSYQQADSGGRQNLLQITDQTSENNDYSILEDLNIVLPLSKIVDRKVFNDKHAERVGVDAYDMAGLLGLPQEECNLYYIAGLIHDVGYLDIPSEILNKKSSLSEKEFNIIKTHTKRGIALLDFAVLPQVLSDGILYHHEKFSGEGYPDGLAGEDIPLVARVISIFDMYEALILPRPQRPAFPAKEAQRIIKKGSGKIFDPAIVKIFEKMAKENLLSREDIWKK